MRCQRIEDAFVCLHSVDGLIVVLRIPQISQRDALDRQGIYVRPDDTALLSANREKMRVAADHLLALINDILEMSQLESGEIVLAREPLDLETLTSDVFTIIEQRAAESEADYGGEYDGAEDYDETDPEDDGPPWDEDGEE